MVLSRQQLPVQQPLGDALLGILESILESIDRIHMALQDVDLLATAAW